MILQEYQVTSLCHTACMMLITPLYIFDNIYCLEMDDEMLHIGVYWIQLVKGTTCVDFIYETQM
jgi:hypothetical protein